MFKKVIFLSFLLLLVSHISRSQQFVWDVSFVTQFDNHEFAKMDRGESKTLFASFLTPTVGLGWGDGKHSLMFGGDLVRFFGDYVKPYQWDLQLFYHFKNTNFDIYAGAYPQGDSYSDFSTAFINDTKRFMDGILEGVKFTYKNDYGYVRMILNWPRRDHEWKSEILTIYSTLKFDFKWFYLGYMFDMNHYAYSISNGNVVDNIWANPFIGFSFNKYLPLQVLDLRLGWIQTIQKDRWITKDFIFPSGGIVDFTIQKWGVGVRNSIYFGKNLMPYYNNLNADGLIYGSELYYGDVMYSTDSGLYNRLEAYYNAFSNGYINLSFNLIMHTDGYGKIGWQQGAKVVVNLNNISWNKLKENSKLKMKNNEENKVTSVN
jgi:hypothetical protein